MEVLGNFLRIRKKRNVINVMNILKTHTVEKTRRFHSPITETGEGTYKAYRVKQ